MGIKRQLSIPLFHPPTAGDNKFQYAISQPIGRPIGTFNKPYCPRCLALWRGIFDTFVGKRHLPPVRIELNIHAALSVVVVPEELEVDILSEGKHTMNMNNSLRNKVV